MAGAPDAFEFVLATARRTLRQVEDDLRNAKPAPGRGAALAAHVTKTLGLIETRVNAAAAAFPAAALPQAQHAHIRNLRLYTQLAQVLHLALPWLDLDSANRVDLGTDYFVDEMALALVGKGVETLVVPESEYMYSTLSWPFKMAALQYLKTDVATGVRPIVLFFPLKEADSALLHVVFAHELGHAAVDEHNLVAKVIDPLKTNPTYEKDLAAATAHIQSAVGWDQARAEAFAVARLRQWVEELLCDALALQYLGPSYLFGFAAFVLSCSWNDPQPQHPQPTLRVALLMEQLRKLGWKDAIEAKRPNLWAWFEWAEATPSPPLADDNKFLSNTCQAQAEAIRKAAAERLGGSSYAPGPFLRQADDLEARIERRILPAETDDGPVDRRSIVLAAWLFVLSRKPDGAPRADGPVAFPEALAETAFQRFIGKALELSTVAETWSALP